MQQRARPRRGDDVAPSLTARSRLAREIRREVADLRVRLSEATLRSAALRDAGLPGAAAEVAAEQQAMLADFRERLDAVVAAAAVEREAERVVAGELGRSEGAEPPGRISTALAALLAAAVVVALSVGANQDLAASPLAGGGGTMIPLAVEEVAGSADRPATPARGTPASGEPARRDAPRPVALPVGSAPTPLPEDVGGPAGPTLVDRLLGFVGAELGRLSGAARALEDGILEGDPSADTEDTTGDTAGSAGRVASTGNGSGEDATSGGTGDTPSDDLTEEDISPDGTGSADDEEGGPAPEEDADDDSGTVFGSDGSTETGDGTTAGDDADPGSETSGSGEDVDDVLEPAVPRVG